MIHRKRRILDKPVFIQVFQGFILLCISFFLLDLDCRESLPPYEEPGRVFTVSLGSSFAFADRVRLDLGQQMLGHEKITFELELVNVFDETLSGDADPVLGEISLWWEDDPRVTATLPVMYTDEVSGHIFQHFGMAAIDPGDTARFSVWWQYCMDDQGQYIWEHAGEGWESEDAGYAYVNYGPMHFILQAKMQPFSAGPAEYSDYYEIWITFYTGTQK